MSHGLISNEVVLAKIESVYGTDPTPSAASDAKLVRNVGFKLDRLRMADRGAIRGSLGTMQQIYAGSLKSFDFECEVKGSGAAGTAPEIGPFLRACGLGETIVASTSVTYAPVSTGHEGLTIYFFARGRVRHIATGCRGNVSFAWKAGDILLAKLSFVGRITTVTDQTQPTPTYNTTVPVAVRGLSSTIGGVSGLVIQNYELDLGNQIMVPDNVNDTEGYGNILITKRDVTLKVQKHADLVATINPWADLPAGTPRAFASGTLGSTAGNRIALTCAQMAYRGIEPGDDNGIRIENYVFGCHEAAADTDVSLAFT